LLFLKDLLGITAISIFFQYDEFDEESKKAKGEKQVTLGQKLLPFVRFAVMGLIVLAVFFQFNIKHYLLLWLVPAISPHMFLMRVRGIAEHGLPRQLGVLPIYNHEVGEFYTRSFLSSKSCYGFKPFVWFEKLMIGTVSVHYHHEHHIVPNVPFYHLEKLHNRISDKVAELNPEVYAPGYVAAAARNLRQGIPLAQRS